MMTSLEWNEKMPVGTQVKYFPIMDDAGELIGDPFETTTRSMAWDLGFRAPVVLLTGKTGGVYLSHLRVIM